MSLELERERIQFERENFQVEMEERQLAREMAMAAQAWERTGLEEEREARRVVQKAEASRANEHIRLTEEANRLQREILTRERRKSEAVSAKVKLYDDAIRNSI
jgi:hypothetical protein